MSGMSYPNCPCVMVVFFCNMGKGLMCDWVWSRAFADFVLGSLILHFFCVNFIN